MIVNGGTGPNGNVQYRTVVILRGIELLKTALRMIHTVEKTPSKPRMAIVTVINFDRVR